MRKIFFAFLLSVVSLATQAQGNIVGSWQVDLQESLSRMSDEAKASYDTLPTPVKERIARSFDQRKFAFQDEGSMTIEWKKEDGLQQVQGTWQYEPSSAKLTITTDISDVNEFEVTELTASVMVLRRKDTGGIFQELYLTKRI